MNLEDIKKFLEENKDQEEVKAYVEGLSSVTPDGVTAFLDTEDGKKLLQPKLDSYFTKGLDTFKQKSMPQLIEDEIAKRNPANKSPEALEVEKALAEIERWKSKTIRESVRNDALKFATDNQLPSEIVDYFIALEKDDDEDGTKSKESTMSNLENLKSVWSNNLQTVVNDKLKSNGFTPKDGEKPKTITREQLEGMSTEEVSALDWEVVSEALKSN
ncbi:capsid assembly scaffolding protein Gp46 family protein [Bacillus solitudinis]|uniref:capsid assembly scaffolding protein Gp46 family protein n=1 Tax=Bacillus solitudinis TaxID=2014074 RepID=UPI0012FD15A3|nr:DUF4355 domain-containing protein [Bacillus solitudinis]